MLTRAFGAKERAFFLDGASWRDLEKARDCGLGMIAARLAPLVALKQGAAEGFPGGVMGAIAAGHLGDARIDDVREPILQGLIGARQISSTEAGELVRNVFDEDLRLNRAPMVSWCELAFDIVSQALVGLSDEPVGERKGAAAGPRRSRSRTAKPAS